LQQLTAQLVMDILLHNNKPVLHHVQTYELSFSRHIAKCISWSDNC